MQAHDVLFWGAKGTNFRALTGLSSRAAGSSACDDTGFSGFAASDALWTGGRNGHEE